MTAITQLNGAVALTAPAAADMLPITDVSDTTENANGTTKPITWAKLFESPTINNPTFTGTYGISADQTFTFSGTPAAENTQFTLRVTNTDTSSHIATIPTSKPEGTATTITQVTVPASCTLYLTWNYHNTVYDLFGTQFAGKHMIPVMAGAMSPSVTGGCATLTAIASAANQPDIRTLDFDATTEEYAQFALPMPQSWDEGTITFEVLWSHAATATNFGTVWGLQGVAVSNDDAIAVAYGTAQTVTDTGGTTNDLYSSPESAAITIAGTPTAGDTVFFRLYRKAADASDTMTIDARLHAIRLYFTSNSETDA
jgi:hypothetical protein